MPGTRRATTAALVGLALTLGACGSPDEGAVTRDVARGQLATVHKSPTCECCGGHEDHLRHEGFGTRSVVHDDVERTDERSAQTLSTQRPSRTG
jgi:hypothetical protein